MCCVSLCVLVVVLASSGVKPNAVPGIVSSLCLHGTGPSLYMF